MGRLPFDASRVNKPEDGPPARREQKRFGEFDGTRPLTITQTCEIIKRALADRVPSRIRVVGEISNFSDRNHWYLSLKDEKSVISCVMWAAAAKKCDFRPESGQQVVATGRVDFYGPQGRVQLYIDKLEPVGQGALEIKFRQLCEELKKQGYFDETHKIPMPGFPEHLAIITSANGAAFHDVARTARGQWPGVKLSLIDARVQGDGAAAEIARAIQAIDRCAERFSIDAIILTRGGGSLEDLWAFNERPVADAVFQCELPIACAIGHETDTTVAELVADMRYSTPTQAGARLVADIAAEHQHIGQLDQRLSLSVKRSIEQARAKLDGLANRPMFKNPGAALEQYHQTLDAQRRRLEAAMRRLVDGHRLRLNRCQQQIARIEPAGRVRLTRQRLQSSAHAMTVGIQRQIELQTMRLKGLERELRAIGPHHVLERGYTYTMNESGELIRAAEQVAPGQKMVTHLVEGKIESEVVQAGKAPRKRPPGKKKSSRKKNPKDDGPSLFD
jgi:exodeoxyribonuclease VII large subunit